MLTVSHVFSVHSVMMLEEVRGLTPSAINCSHRRMYVQEIHYWFDRILTVPFSEDVVSFMIPWHLNDRYLCVEGYMLFGLHLPIEHWTCLKLMPCCRNECFIFLFHSTFNANCVKKKIKGYFVMSPAATSMTEVRLSHGIFAVLVLLE